MEYLAKAYPHLPVKVGALLNKQIVHTTTIAEYYERAMETCHHGTYRYVPVLMLFSCDASNMPFCYCVLYGSRLEKCGVTDNSRLITFINAIVNLMHYLCMTLCFSKVVFELNASLAIFRFAGMGHCMH